METIIIDLDRGTPHALPNKATAAAMPLWLPDGNAIIRAVSFDGHWNICLQRIDNPSSEVLFKGDPLRLPEAITPDGTSLLYSQQESDGIVTLGTMKIDNPKDFTPYKPESTQLKDNPALSPDGQWLAYDSRESGKDEVYIETFLTNGRKRQVSLQGGREALWSPDGKEIYYRAGQSI